jgi:hypothetical protein
MIRESPLAEPRDKEKDRRLIWGWRVCWGKDCGPVVVAEYYMQRCEDLETEIAALKTQLQKQSEPASES